MSTNELTLTLVGWLGTEPRHYPGVAGSTPFTTFRMASTRRWFDREKGLWVDGRTQWFTVKSWRSAARNVAESLRKGDPVVVHGRLSTEEWTAPEGVRTSLVLDAIAIGPDLAYGTARFARTVHTGPGSDDAEEIDDQDGLSASADEPEEIEDDLLDGADAQASGAAGAPTSPDEETLALSGTR